MSLAEDMAPDEGGDDIFAAEYVLGVLPGEDRRLAALRIETEQVFARLVDRWEVYFSPLAAAYASVEAPEAVKAAVDRRLFAIEARAAEAEAPGLFASLGFWRGLAMAAIAALLLFVALPFFNPPAEIAQEKLVASLSADGSEVRYIALYDPETQEIGLSHVGGDTGQGRDFELWVIEGEQAPVSLGVIPAGAIAQLPVLEDLRPKMSAGSVFAISLEPAGGSPTGAPTGPVVAAGDLKPI